MSEEKIEDSGNGRDVLFYINIVITVLLIVTVAFAVNQRFLEHDKCVEWSNGRIFEIMTSTPNPNYICELNCNVSTDSAEDLLSADITGIRP